MVTSGKVTNVEREVFGSDLAAGVIAGAEAIEVNDIDRFDSSGQLQFEDDGEIATFTVPTDSEGDIDLAAPLEGPHAEGTFVKMYPEHVEWWADVQEKGGTGTERCRVRRSLVPMIQQGIRSESDDSEYVEIEEIGTELVVVDVLLQDPILDLIFAAGTLIGATIKTSEGAGDTEAGIVIDAQSIRAFDSNVEGTYEADATTGLIVVGALVGETTRQRIEVDRHGLAMFGGTEPEYDPPSDADLAFSTLPIRDPDGTVLEISNIVDMGSVTRITTTTNHGLGTSDLVEIRGVQGAVEVNGFWTVTVINLTTFEIPLAAFTAWVSNTGYCWEVAPKGQFTTDTDTSGARLWFDKQGLHATYQNHLLNDGAPFRIFDFDPANSKGLRLHTYLQRDAIRVDPIKGISFKLAEEGNPLGNLAAQWVRPDGSTAAAAWGDDLGDNTIHGQMNTKAYHHGATGIAQARLGAQDDGGTPADYAWVTCTNNYAGISEVRASVKQGASELAAKIVDDGGESDFQWWDEDLDQLSQWTSETGFPARTADNTWALRTIQSGTGISVSYGAGVAGNPSIAIDTAVVAQLAAINTFTKHNTFQADTATLSLTAKQATGHTGNIFRVLDAGATAAFFAVSSTQVILADGMDIPVGSSSGTKIATAGTQKLGFYGKAPVIRPTGVAVTAAGIHAALVSLGLITA